MSIELFGWQIPDWQVYVAIGILIMSWEIFSAGFVMLPIGLAFAVTGVFSLWVTSFPWQLVILALNLVVIFFIFKKYITPKFIQDHTKTNADSMVGQEALVIQDIDAGGTQGYVKLYGDEWRAVPEEGVAISKGQKVIITRLSGNKVYVKTKSLASTTH